MAKIHYKIEELVTAEELAEIRGMARQPACTIDQVHEWLLARGYTLARSSVGRWKQSIDEELMAERFDRTGALARAIESTVDRGGIEAIADGAMKQLTQVVFEQASRLEQDGEMDPLDVMRWTRSLKNLVGANSENQKLKRELAEEKRKSAAALAAAETTAKEGGTTDAVVSRMREILGIAA